MRSQPGVQMSGTSKSTTEVLCPAGCGHVVLRLAADEGIYRSASPGAASGQTRQKTGNCGGCQKPYSVPVTTETSR
jgi:hypothetical protein